VGSGSVRLAFAVLYNSQPNMKQNEYIVQKRTAHHSQASDRDVQVQWVEERERATRRFWDLSEGICATSRDRARPMADGDASVPRGDPVAGEEQAALSGRGQ
jgi:hypothetical protein